MDQRETFNNNDELHAVIQHLFTEKKRVSLLVDNNGLMRMEGQITALESGNAVGKTRVVIDSSAKILLEQIIAVNGLFRSDYSEC